MRLAHYQFNQAYHSVKLDYSDLSFSSANPIWESSRLVGFTGNIYSAVALHNHKVATELAEACFRDGEDLTVDLICGFQHALSCGLYTPHSYVEDEDRPGEFKNKDTVDGLIDVGASPDDIEEILTDLVNDMPRIADMNDTLVAAAYLHARLIFIRPFAVANGLVSRLVMNYWLRQQEHPPIVVHSTEATRYKKCLEEFDVREDIEPLALFLCEQLTEFWSNQMTATEEAPKKTGFKLRL